MPDALLVTTSFLPGRGGIETYLAGLCRELSPRLAVMAPEVRGGERIPTDLPYPVSGYRGRMLVPDGRVAAAIRRAAEANRVSKVLFGTPWPLLLLAPRLKTAGLSYAVILHGAELVAPSAVPLLPGRLARALSEA